MFKDTAEYCSTYVENLIYCLKDIDIENKFVLINCLKDP